MRSRLAIVSKRWRSVPCVVTRVPELVIRRQTDAKPLVRFRLCSGGGTRPSGRELVVQAT